MEIQLTAPYFPSQNSIAEHMNCMLVELAYAMLIASKLPEYLWEQAVARVAYVQNHTYTIAVSRHTFYKAWNKRKPNVSHLREFSTPVWVFLQRQHVT